MPGDSNRQGQRRDRDRDKNPQTPLSANAPAKNGNLDPDLDPGNREAFERVKAAYPDGTYPQSDWLIGEREACHRVEEGARWSELEAGELRYRDQLVARGKLGTEFVYSPKNFFTVREKRWREPWPLPSRTGNGSRETIGETIARLNREADEAGEPQL